MCLAVPGKIVRWIARDHPFARAEVQFGGVCRQVSLECVPNANVGDYVLVHAGIAISRIDPDEAARVWLALEELELAELNDSESDMLGDHGSESGSFFGQ